MHWTLVPCAGVGRTLVASPLRCHETWAPAFAGEKCGVEGCG